MNKIWVRWTLALAIALFGFLIRIWATHRLPVDFDERIYLRAAKGYAAIFSKEDWTKIITFADNREHPPLVKMLYGARVADADPNETFHQSLFKIRHISAFFGSLAAFVIAAADPVAGVLMAVQTLVVKYTSEAYLEAFPLFFAMVALFALKRSASPLDRYSLFSSAALGIMAAGKYSYAPIAAVLIYIAMAEKKWRLRHLGIYLATSFMIFFMVNPNVWIFPLAELKDSTMFHVRYWKESEAVKTDFPWYQPILWISHSTGAQWHPTVYRWFGVDGAIFWLALTGLWWEWRERRWLVIWIVSATLILLIWPTKCPQYTLMVLPAFCLGAAATVHRIFAWGWSRTNKDSS